MIHLNPGIYTKKQMLELDYGTSELPTIKENIIIANPHGFGVPSYRISKVKQNGCYLFKIEEFK